MSAEQAIGMRAAADIDVAGAEVAVRRAAGPAR